jgi:signal transduction histidine kinase
MASSKLHFKFESRLAKLLGRQSVTNERDAVFELVKNSYDADSPKVEVTFSDILTGLGKITIRDYGVGMTKDDIEKKFMVVATSSRARETITESGRIVVGEKGVGRFAMERLGRKTTIISYPKKESIAYKLTIEWDRYEAEDTTFDEIGNDFEPFPKDDPKNHGVEIICENLRDVWDEEKIRSLNKKLGSLIIPEGFKTKLPFEIILNAPELGLSETTVKSNLLEKAPYRLVAKLHDNRIQLTIWEKGKKIVSVEKGDHIIESVSMRCGPATYRMWGFPFDKPGEKHWTNYYGMRYIDTIHEFIRDNQGIMMYRDGFRVMPYGERGIDWTDRGGAARSKSGVLPIHNMVGWVEISAAENKELVPTLTRHRLIEDEKFEDLRNFVMKADEILDKHMHEERVKKRQEIKKNIPDALEGMAKKINDLEIIDEIKKPLIRNLKDCSIYLRDQEEEHERDQERLMYKVEAYRNLASLGLSTAAIAHELNIHLGNILSISERLRRHVESGQLSNSELLKMSIELYSSTQFVQDYMSFIRQFSSTLRSDDPTFRKKKVLNVKDELKTSFQWFEHYFKRYNIEPIVDLPDDLEVYMFRADIQSILMNLLSNSIKAIQKERKHMDEVTVAKKANKIRISLDSNPRITNLQIIYSNDGPPINPKIADKIFETFVSDYDELDKTSMGSGLGLPLVKEILESYGGQIELNEGEFNPGVSFRISLPWEGIKKV